MFSKLDALLRKAFERNIEGLWKQFARQIQIDLIIGVIKEYYLAAISALGDMMEMAGNHQFF